jgi:serine/threonine-protein kinase
MRAEMADDLTGRLLAGRYRLDRLLAVGGMARVWAGTDLVLSRPVAVKVLHAHLAADRQFVQRFRREAVAVARLNHPSIVAIYDTCSEDGQEAIVMELVPGMTLRQRLDEFGPLSLAEALGMGSQVAAALAEAHEVGIIHRDIKPANILLAGDGGGPGSTGPGPGGPGGPVGRAFVSDFGIAKAIHDADGDTTDLTRVGSVLGTAKYVAPEQLEGRPVDARTDIYALGLVLYEALCGRPPWSTDSSMSSALARLHSQPLRPRQVRADIPRDVERVILRAMARRPEDRYASAADLRAALLAAQQRVVGPADVTVAEPTSPGPELSFVRSERSWLVPSAVVVAVAALLVAAGLIVGRTSAGQDLVDRVTSAFGSDSDGTATTTTLPAGPVDVTQVTDIDPAGDGEHTSELGNLIDGDPTTTWSTEGYQSDWTALRKSGVGLAFELPASTALRTMEVDSPTPGWTGDIYVTDQAGLRSGPEGWGQPVTSLQADGRPTTFPLPAGTNGRAVLLWITSLGPAQAGSYRAVIAEVGFTG